MPKPMLSKTEKARLQTRAREASARLSLLASDEPPHEFRIFRAGLNKTSKGDFVFDEEAARLVMGEYRKHGVDVMIDLEHLSLDSEGTNYDPSAYGWCKLELRAGELWAVNVTWTSAGAQRLRDKESRYISPAFHYLTENGRITALYNIAICAVPATYETPALVAASKRVGKQIGTLTVEVTKMDKIAVALGLKEDASLEDILAAIAALQEPDGDEGEGDGEAADDPEADDGEAADDGDDVATTAEAIKGLPKKMQAKILASLASGKGMAERLAKLEKTTKSAAVEALIAANADKLPKSLEAWARKQDAETLSEYFKNATPVKKEAKTPPKQETHATGEVVLTAADHKVIKLTNADPKAFLEQKKKIAEQAAANKAAALAD